MPSTRSRAAPHSQQGGTDFGGLFLGFSLFLIAASLMLVGLLFRLALDRRGAEVGLLLAAGYRVRTVQRLLLMEGLTVATLGAAMGLALGLAYNRLLLALLVHLWPDRAVVNLLRPHATSLTFALGFGLTIAMSAAALWLSLRWLVRVPPPALLRGETQRASNVVKQRSRSLTWLCIACATLGVGLVIAGRFLTSNPDYLAMTFFAGGGLCLISGLGAAWLWMRRTRHTIVNGRGVQALGLLGIRNAARNPVRSLLTTALLAAAAFLLVAVESFRRQPGSEFLDKTGGSGGFNLIAETDVPLFQSFADPLGRKELETQAQQAVRPGWMNRERTHRMQRVLESAGWRRGVSASPPRRRRRELHEPLPGRPAARAGRAAIAHRSRRVQVLRALARERRRRLGESVKLLLEPQPDDAIPVFCEQNTAQWMLKTAVGGAITMPGDDGAELTFRIVGTFVDSPFQSEL